MRLHYLRLIGFCFIMINLLFNNPVAHAGAFTKFNRIYPGEPLAAEQVAFIIKSSGIVIKQIFSISYPSSFWDGEQVGAELLPGNYDFCIGYYSRSADIVRYVKGCIPMRVNLAAGHIYCFLPNLQYKSFSPVLWDITLEGERRKAEKMLEMKSGSLDEDINKINEYLTGKRSEAKFAGQVAIAQKSLENQIASINQVWNQIKSGNVIEISFQDKTEVVVVEKLKEDLLMYNNIKEPDVTFSVKKGQIKRLIFLADSIEIYKKTVNQ